MIIDYIERGEEIPSQEQLARDIDGSAKSWVSTLLANLEREGFITSEKTPTGRIKTRTIRLNKMQNTRPIPVLGRVAAGQPLLANGDDIIEFIRLPSQHVRGTEIYMLEVSGDSMRGDGILDGDYVIVDRSREPEEGEIAVVLIGEEATIKHLRREGESIRLVSSNDKFKDQVYKESDGPVIQGKVIGVVRWSS